MAKKLILTKECVHLRICMSNLRSEMNFPTYGILLIVKTLFGGWFFRNSFNHPFEFKNCGIFFGVKKKSHFLASNHQKHVHVDVCFSKFFGRKSSQIKAKAFLRQNGGCLRRSGDETFDDFRDRFDVLLSKNFKLS